MNLEVSYDESSFVDLVTLCHSGHFDEAALVVRDDFDDLGSH